jgi:hypothetical protein
VKTVSQSQTLDILINCQSSVHDLKVEVSRQTFIPVHEQVLTLGGKSLKNDTSIASLRLGNRSIRLTQVVKVLYIPIVDHNAERPITVTADIDVPNADVTIVDLNDSDQSRGRKRRRDVQNWKRNVVKRKRNVGEEYTNSRNHPVPRKSVQKFDCGGCRYRCKENVDEESREACFHHYWKQGNKSLQNDFIIARVIVKPHVSGNCKHP